MGSLQGQGGGETKGTAHLPALPSAGLRAEDQGPGEGRGRYRSKDVTQRIYDTIIVVTDRKVLDKQLQHTINQLEQTRGVVNSVDRDSGQLREFLEQSKDIIISTIQKFPMISESISRLRSRTFGVIIDC